jgi:hypothetical protein
MKVIINFTWFLLRLFKNRQLDGGPKVSESIYKERLSICELCPKRNNKGLLVKLKGPRCSICGCFIFWKSQYKFEQCPDTPPKWEMMM